jgi:Nucleoside-diphosphate-sugar epimerases
LIYVDDVADACIHFLKKKTKDTVINIGSGKEKKIIDYAKFIIKQLKVKLKIKLDKSKLDGTPRKLLSNKLSAKYGWKAKIGLEEGFKKTYESFIKENY